MCLLAAQCALAISIFAVWIRSLGGPWTPRRLRRLTSCCRRSVMTAFPERREEMTGGSRRPRSLCAYHWECSRWTKGHTEITWRPARSGERCTVKGLWSLSATIHAWQPASAGETTIRASSPGRTVTTADPETPEAFARTVHAPAAPGT